jgi:hypothetical protein
MDLLNLHRDRCPPVRAVDCGTAWGPSRGAKAPRLRELRHLESSHVGARSLLPGIEYIPPPTLAERGQVILRPQPGVPRPDPNMLQQRDLKSCRIVDHGEHEASNRIACDSWGGSLVSAPALEPTAPGTTLIIGLIFLPLAELQAIEPRNEGVPNPGGW